MRSRLRSTLPGLVLVLLLTAAAFLAAQWSALEVLGPLVLALALGVAAGALPAVRRRGVAAGPGVRFAAGGLLKLGIVLLGVRMDVRALAELGPQVLAGSVLGVVAAFLAVEGAGRAWRVPADLRRAVAMGTAVCGASAIAAALPVLRARSEHASVAIGSISLVGTVGVLGFAAWHALERVVGSWTAMLAGATLQEVGHVVAVGGSVGGPDGDLALLVKLSRVVLLAPTLILLGLAVGATDEAGTRAGRAPLVPRFVLGFVGLGLATNLGVVPVPVVVWASLAGTGATAAAMAAIGLGVDLRVLGRSGRSALALAAVGFGVLLAVMVAYYGMVV